MQDPKPENIVGQKRHTHSWEHSVRWDLLIAAVVAGYVAWKFLGGRSSRSSRESEESVTEEIAGEFEEIDVTDGGGGLYG
jgi:hypothetical protein